MHQSHAGTCRAAPVSPRLLHGPTLSVCPTSPMSSSSPSTTDYAAESASAPLCAIVKDMQAPDSDEASSCVTWMMNAGQSPGQPFRLSQEIAPSPGHHQSKQLLTQDRNTQQQQIACQSSDGLPTLDRFKTWWPSRALHPPQCANLRCQDDQF